jgi:hypothetical protein
MRSSLVTSTALAPVLLPSTSSEDLVSIKAKPCDSTSLLGVRITVDRCTLLFFPETLMARETVFPAGHWLCALASRPDQHAHTTRAHRRPVWSLTVRSR